MRIDNINLCLDRYQNLGGNPLASLYTGLTSYWTLNEATGLRVDSIGASGNDLSVSGTILGNTGKIGNAAYFTGSPNYLHHIDSVTLSPTSSHTWSLWVYGNISAGGFLYYLSKDDGASRSYGLYNPGANILGYYCFSSTGVFSDAQVSGFVDNTWTHVVCGWNATDGKTFIYKDNGTINQGAVLANVRDGTAEFAVGARSGGSLFPVGRMDEIAFYNGRVLTAGERSLYFNGGNGVALF